MPDRPETTQLHLPPDGLAVAITKTRATLADTRTDEGRRMVRDDFLGLTSIVRVSGGSWAPSSKADFARSKRDGTYQVTQPHISADGEVWNETTNFFINPDGSVTITTSDTRPRVYPPRPYTESLKIDPFERNGGIMVVKTLEARVDLKFTPLGATPVLSYLMRLTSIDREKLIPERSRQKLYPTFDDYDPKRLSHS